MHSKLRFICVILVVTMTLAMCCFQTEAISTLSISYQNEAPDIVSGSLYYIKNVQSGKYLDVEYANDSDGANVS